jgi:hypothetical protein
MRESFMNDPAAPPRRPGFSPWQFGLLLALFVCAAFPQVVFGLETFVARDFGFFAYPLAYFQRECFWRGELPFWDPYNNCGVPFLAQWNTMPLYPPALIYLTLPLAWSLSVFSLAHLWFAGLGMFLLARRWTGNPFAATFAGTVFAFNGFTLNLLMWPSHIATFSWLPWVVLTMESAWREGGKKIPLAAFAGALQMLAGGPETIALTWLIVLTLWLQAFGKAETPRGVMLWRSPLVLALVLSLSAAQLLPFLDLVTHAQRETGYTDLRWSLPRTGLANFLVPMAFGTTATEGIFFQFGQNWTSSYYLGIATLWLALLAIFGLPQRWRQIRGTQPVRVLGLAESRRIFRWVAEFCNERAWLLTVLSAIALLCALGENTPFYPWLRKLVPQLSMMTYPVKFIMVLVFAAPLLAAFALTELPNSRTRLLSVGAVLLLLLGGVVFWTQHPAGDTNSSHTVLMNGLSRAGFLLITGAILFGLAREKKSHVLAVAPMLLILTAWLDVLTHEPQQNPTTPPDVFRPDLGRTWLAMNPQPALGGSRVMLSPDAALAFSRFGITDPRNNFLAKRMGGCADANLLDAIPKVDGFFSLAPRHFDELLSHVYGVTGSDWTRLKDFMGVSQYSSTNFIGWQARTNFLPLITAGQKPVFLDNPSTLAIFARNAFDPATTVFLSPDEESLVAVSNPAPAKILASKFGNTMVDFEIQAAESTLAVVAQTYYHPWHAEIDGHPAPLLRANVTFQAVPVPSGVHRVHLFYQDRSFAIGAAISVCMWVNCLVSYLALRRRDLPTTPGRKLGDHF